MEKEFYPMHFIAFFLCMHEFIVYMAFFYGFFVPKTSWDLLDIFSSMTKKPKGIFIFFVLCLGREVDGHGFSIGAMHNLAALVGFEFNLVLG